MKGYTVKKKHRRSIHRMNKLLIRIMGVVKHKSPVTVCSVCCAVIAIMYRRMDDEAREAISPVLAECFKMVTEDQEKMQAGERVH